MMGIEPTTTGATIRGSTTELHPPLTKSKLENTQLENKH